MNINHLAALLELQAIRSFYPASDSGSEDAGFDFSSILNQYLSNVGGLESSQPAVAPTVSTASQLQAPLAAEKPARQLRPSHLPQRNPSLSAAKIRTLTRSSKTPQKNTGSMRN